MVLVSFPLGYFLCIAISGQDRTTDADFLNQLTATLPKLIEQQKPDFIFYLAGVDILASDKLGKLACTMEGCKKRDQFVLEICKKHEIPLQVSMGGGYSPEIKTIIEAHATTFRVARTIFS